MDSFPSFINENKKIALVDGDNSHSYSEINLRINRFATGLLNGETDLEEERGLLIFLELLAVLLLEPQC